MGKRGNPHHDPHNGQFTSGGGGGSGHGQLNIPAGRGQHAERHRGGRASQAYKDAREGVAPPKEPRFQPDRTTRHPVPTTHVHYPSGSLTNEHRSGHRRSR